MKPATIDDAHVPGELQGLYRLIQGELDEVEVMLRDVPLSGAPFVDRLVQHSFRLGGKRLRPALLLLSGMASGELKPGHRVLATVVEMIHTATLIHDDVLDEATLRRHAQTVNARWDNEASVLLGDYLFARAMRLVTSLDDTHVCQVLSDAVARMCEGELRQAGSRGDFDLGEDDYMAIIADKTAALCECSCRLGAYWAGADQRTQDALAQYGHHLGTAFQITDDVLDVNGNEAATGKSLGTDLIKQKATLPVIRLLQGINGDRRRELLATLARADGQAPDALKPWLAESDAVAYAEQAARQCAARAQECLQATPASLSRDALSKWVDFVVTRRH
jgi:octaprenyl-diphosphate synthase